MNIFGSARCAPKLGREGHVCFVLFLSPKYGSPQDPWDVYPPAPRNHFPLQLGTIISLTIYVYLILPPLILSISEDSLREGVGFISTQVVHPLGYTLKKDRLGQDYVHTMKFRQMDYICHKENSCWDLVQKNLRIQSKKTHKIGGTFKQIHCQTYNEKRVTPSLLLSFKQVIEKPSIRKMQGREGSQP